MRIFWKTSCLWLVSLTACGQSYTTYFTGNTNDVITAPMGGVCLMGGATEHDEAMKWFLQRADGGDILVLRASGSDGYNNYLYSQLGISVNSVETIVFNNATANSDPYVLERISKAEGIWMAGGDQWNYVSYWRNTAVDSLINDGLENRNIVIGGTSAGMAVQGGLYFSAQNGTVTSAAALSNPYNIDMTVDSADFLHNNFLENVITDTHYDNPDRKGRHVAFMARALVDYGMDAKGIACDEYTAVCIDDDGLARVYGEYPTYDDNAYFIQVNCEVLDNQPENCSAGSPLSWVQGSQAIKVYAVKGTDQGSNNFSLTDWQTGSGGTWENWFVSNGTLGENNGNPINCGTVSVSTNTEHEVVIYPTSVSDLVMVSSDLPIQHMSIVDETGRAARSIKLNGTSVRLDLSELISGTYLMKLETSAGQVIKRIIKL